MVGTKSKLTITDTSIGSSDTSEKIKKSSSSPSEIKVTKVKKKPAKKSAQVKIQNKSSEKASKINVTDTSDENKNSTDQSNENGEKNNSKSLTSEKTKQQSPKARFKGKPNNKFSKSKRFEKSGEKSTKFNRNQNNNKSKPGVYKELTGDPVSVSGLIEISNKGFGFVRNEKFNFEPDKSDIFITPDMVRKYSLRNGIWVEGNSKTGNRGPQLVEIISLNGKNPDKIKFEYMFDELTAINPNKRIVLETNRDKLSNRVIDMMTPIGYGQRGLIVAPPRTGKTTLLHHLAEAMTEKNPDVKLIILLVDERPEEVTEFRKKFPNADIMASSNDSEIKTHVKISQLAIERGKRYVEMGENVFILLDSITRLARAFNNSMRGKGRTGSGGVDIRALEIPRKLFAAARNTREAGSLTIIATALIETNSRADEVIFREFKGTGNMEIVLDRNISEKMIFPAIDIFKSGTRREELLLPAHQLEKIYLLRRGLSGNKPVDAIERLLKVIGRFENNAKMLIEIKTT